MKLVLASLGLVAGLAALAGQASAQSPGSVTIRRIVHAGTGCPAGTVAENISPDLQAFTLLFDSYVAETGPGVPFSQARKNCQLNLDFAYPDGWSFALVGLDVRGYASLDAGISGLVKSTYYFQGDRNQGTFEVPFGGPLDTDYQLSDLIPVVNAVWSPCGGQTSSRSLNINTQARLDNAFNRFGRGVLTVDSIDGFVAQTYRIAWRRCR